MDKRGNTNYQKCNGGAVLFALAIWVLAVSCPLKSILNYNAVLQSSVASRSSLTNSKQDFSNVYASNATCFAGKAKTVSLRADKMQYFKADAPVFTINVFNHTGYYIHSIPDGINTEYNLAADSDYSSLPLFLQHRGLLI